MSHKQQRRACSLHALQSGSAPPRSRFRALDHAKLKLLLYTDPGRALDGFKAAQIASLMQWPYYEQLKERDPDQARLVCALAKERGIPEKLERP